MKKPKDTNFLGMKLYQPESGEAYMNERQKRHFAMVLQCWYRSLISEATDFIDSLQSNAAMIDPLDRAAFEENQRMVMRASDRRRRLQAKIDLALERIKGSSFGYCKTCDAEIGLERLEARPTADECIRCKTVAEIQEKRCVGRELRMLMPLWCVLV